MAQYDTPQDDDEPDLDPLSKVAILFIGLGQDTTGEVMKYLNDVEI